MASAARAEPDVHSAQLLRQLDLHTAYTPSPPPACFPTSCVAAARLTLATMPKAKLFIRRVGASASFDLREVLVEFLPRREHLREHEPLKVL